MKNINLLFLLNLKNFLRAKKGKALFLAIIFYIFLYSIIPHNEILTFHRGSIGFFEIIIIILAIFGACDLISSEIREKTIQFALTQPIKEKEIIISKFLTINFISLFILLIFGILLQILSLIFFKKLYLSSFYSLFSLILVSLCFSSFTILLTVRFPHLTTAIFVLIFQNDLIKQSLASLQEAKFIKEWQVILKKIGVFLLNTFYYLLPSTSEISLKIGEFKWDKDFFNYYYKYFLYSILITIFYLTISIYIFKLRRNKILEKS